MNQEDDWDVEGGAGAPPVMLDTQVSSATASWWVGEEPSQLSTVHSRRTGRCCSVYPMLASRS